MRWFCLFICAVWKYIPYICTTKPIFSSIIFMRNKNHGLRMHSQRLCLIRPRTYRNKACVRIFKFSNRFFDTSGSWDLTSSFKFPVPSSQFLIYDFSFFVYFFQKHNTIYYMSLIDWKNKSRIVWSTWNVLQQAWRWLKAPLLNKVCCWC